MVKSIIREDYLENCAENFSTVQVKELKDDQYMCNVNDLKMGEWQLEEILTKEKNVNPNLKHKPEYEEKQNMPNNEQHKSKAN